MKKKKYSIKEDLAKYPKYIFRNKRLIPIEHIGQWWGVFQAHHFVPQKIREKNPKFYSRVEHLQKIIFVSPKLNYDLEFAGEVFIFVNYGVPKKDLVFSRKAWREGYYD
jgi:hypothetical protein